uniref:CHCH domain-containing protein n=1 Tax=Electrophorus electricus TaxID=8005 RepID=A0A4W4F045_ELEEL
MAGPPERCGLVRRACMWRFDMTPVCCFVVWGLFLLLSEASCVTEMSLLMACWKQHEFNNALCSSEVSAFYRCVENAQTERRNQAKNLALGQGGRLLPKQANKLLKRHPNLTREI